MYTKSSFMHRYSWYGWFVCCLAATFYCYEYLLRIEPSVMEIQLRQHFLSLSAGGLGLLSSMYYWAYTPMQAVVGVLTDRYGPRKTLTAAIGFCVLGTFIFADTQLIYVAAIGRFLVGCGSAFAFVGVLKLVAMWLPEKYFAVFAGLTTSLGMLGALCGDIGMTWMVHHLGWHEVLILSAFVGIALIPIFYFFVHERLIHEPASANEDLKHYMLGFIKLIKKKDILIAGVVGCLMYLSLSAFAEMWGIPFLQRVMPGPHVMASTLNAMVFLGWLIGGPISGLLSQYFKSRRQLLIWGSIAAALCFCVILYNPAISSVAMGGLLFLFGVLCSPQVLCFAVGRDHVHLKSAASAAAAINMLVMVSGMLLQPLMSRILDWAWSGQMSAGLREYSVNDYRIALTILPVALIISAVLAYFMRESFGQGTSIDYK